MAKASDLVKGQSQTFALAKYMSDDNIAAAMDRMGFSLESLVEEILTDLETEPKFDNRMRLRKMMMEILKWREQRNDKRTASAKLTHTDKFGNLFQVETRGNDGDIDAIIDIVRTQNTADSINRDGNHEEVIKQSTIKPGQLVDEPVEGVEDEEEAGTQTDQPGRPREESDGISEEPDQQGL